MSLFELFLIAVGLSADAFAVSVCKGLSLPKIQLKHGIIVGLYFGGFQAGMPLLGYLLGSQFKDAIVSVDHWIAFILLTIIGGNMILASRKQEEEACDASLHFISMIVLAVATSIDALAVGVTFAFLQVQIIPAISFIGITTFFLSAIGLKVGNVFGLRYKSKAEFIGGMILVCMGGQILLSHLL